MNRLAQEKRDEEKIKKRGETHSMHTNYNELGAKLDEVTE